ncbi:MAG TPA: UDP-N-acetylglucosamine--N-acetylmuramyl-(pentapeptide) pyrophosphoryl-undecaprenol N-acetylglucosamine transferase [Acidimicrobiales bacterium]|nr:UDP-N-acetylglucosamine--N-acetylmuramyl-(pentapeptide) pyrophosphoryl-undecaprenol N-acetylglucosamine transferase [Acidimicrobiales bacterium]
MIAGGGTGGHLYPGLAVARELVERGHDPATLHFVGARHGLEARTRALADFPSTLLLGRGLKRKLSVGDILSNISALTGEVLATLAALRLFSRWRPAIVVSLGGYASLPCVVAAMAWRVPVLVVNVDAVPGAVNRFASKVATCSAVGTPEVRLPRAYFTGVPVRSAMARIDRTDAARSVARQRLGLPQNALVVAVSGGSLGSLRINRATLELARLWSSRAGTAIYHVVGRRDWDEFGFPAQAFGELVYLRVPYEEDMAALYCAADIAVQRAGANAVAELAIAGVPAVLVPLPGSPGDHQGQNARAMALAGGAVVVKDEELDGPRLAKELEDLLASPERLRSMGQAARKLARPDATAAIADLVEKYARAVAK